MIDFSFPPEVDEVRLKVREFMDSRVRPEWEAIDQDDRSRGRDGASSSSARRPARNGSCGCRTCRPSGAGWGSARRRWRPCRPRPPRSSIGPFVLNAQAPDEGNQHTLLHWATDEQKEKYLRPLCEGTARSCFAMTEPEVAGSDPTLIQTHRLPRRRRVGDQRPQVVHLRRPRRQVRAARRPHRGGSGDPAGGATRASSSTCRRTAGPSCATCTRCRAATTTARS